MVVVVKHNKTDTIADWTQADLDAQIALGNFPSGTLLANIVLPSDWNANHVITGLATVASTGAYTDLTGTPSSLPPSGTAGGQLTGSYPNPNLLNIGVTGQPITGYTSGAGVVGATDTILQAIQKLNGNQTALVTGVSSVSNADGTITFSPTTGAVVGSINLASNNTWTGNITMGGTSNQLLASTGVTAAGSGLPIAFTGDDDTGFFRSAANNFGVSAGGTQMMLFQGSSTPAVIRLNRAMSFAFGSTLASASTVDLGTATGNQVQISGTTTITSLGTTPQTGSTYWVRFTGILTLTNGSNLILLSGANITTAAGDIAQFVYEGTSVWRMQDYTRADGTALISGGGTYLAGTGLTLTGSTFAIDSTVTTLTGSQILTNKTLTDPVLSQNASPSYARGKLVYDTSNECLTFYNNDPNVGIQLGQEEWIKVVNNTGSSIGNGVPVYISGVSSAVATIALARANAQLTAYCIGLTTETIANGATGYVTNMGVVHSMDTSAFSVGPIYLSAASAGVLTQTAPSSPNYLVKVGDVLTVNASTGSIQVTPQAAIPLAGVSGQTAIQFQDEGSNIGSSGAITTTNFTGTGVTASVVGTTLTVNVAGGGGSGLTMGQSYALAYGFATTL